MMTVWRMLQTSLIWTGLVNFAVETGLDITAPGARLWYVSRIPFHVREAI
jgi:hypothetical protein